MDRRLACSTLNELKFSVVCTTVYVPSFLSSTLSEYNLVYSVETRGQGIGTIEYERAPDGCVTKDSRIYKH